MATPILQDRLSSLSFDNTPTNSMVEEICVPSPEVRQNSSFDSSTCDTSQQTKERRLRSDSSSIFRTNTSSLPQETAMIPSSPSGGTIVRCFTTNVFASTKDQLRHDLKHLQVQLKNSHARRVKLEQELAEAKQIAFITHQHFQESQHQYNQLKVEVETIQTADDSLSRESSQVTILHSQRTVLAQRVLQLLAQNGKLQATSVKLQHRMEEQESTIQQLEHELHQLKSSEAMMMMTTSQTATTTTCSRSWIGRSHPSSKQGSKGVPQAIDAPPTAASHQASLEQRIQELESQNRLLLEQQEHSKKNWEQERNRMQQHMTVLKQKALELENTKVLYRTESPQKRDFPPFTISYEDEDCPDKDQLSYMTYSTCSVTHASRSSWTSPSAYLALQGRLQHVETQLHEKEALEATLTQQVEDLRQMAQEEKHRAESAEERVQSLRAYLNTSWSKQHGRYSDFSSYHEMMLTMSAEDPTHNSDDHQERERALLSSLETGTTVQDAGSKASDSPSLEIHVAPLAVETPSETKPTSEEYDQLQERFHAMEQKCYTLRSKNAQLQHRFEQKCQENSELEDLVEQLKSRNGDGAETIFALLRHVEKSAESDAHQKALQQQVDNLTTERDDLMKQLGEAAQQLANAEDRIIELYDLNTRLNMEVQSSTGTASQKSLQDKVDAQERELNNYQARCDQLEKESAHKVESVKQLQEQNEWLLAEIATLSKNSSDLSAELALAHEEIESLRHALQEKSEKCSSLQAANDRNLEEPQTIEGDNINENEDLPEQSGKAEETELLVKMTEALETSLKEANEQRRELEVTLANTRLDLEIAQAKINDLSSPRATAHVDVSTNPTSTSIDGRLQIYQLEKENQSLSRACEDKENRLNDALMQCNQHEQMLETVTVQVLELQLQINELEEGKRELMKQSEIQLEASNGYAKDLESRINDLQCEIVSLESERDGLQAQVESQRAWLESTASKLHEMQDTLEDCREELESSKRRVKELEGKVHAPDEDAASLAENEVVDVELSTSNDDQLHPTEASENTSPNHGKRTFKEIFSFGRKAV